MQQRNRLGTVSRKNYPVSVGGGGKGLLGGGGREAGGGGGGGVWLNQAMPAFNM